MFESSLLSTPVASRWMTLADEVPEHLAPVTLSSHSADDEIEEDIHHTVIHVEIDVDGNVRIWAV